MNDEAKRVGITCPRCGRCIASVPENDLPKGHLVCPGCGALVQAPGKADMLIEDAKEKIKDMVEDVIGPSEKEGSAD